MKIVKACCGITKKKVLFQVSDDGKTIVGMARLSDSAYAATESQIYLSPDAVCKKSCSDCGKNKVFSCDHKYRRLKCGASASPDLECACCNKMEPDYGASKTVNPLQMKRGEIVRIPLNDLIIGLNWERSRSGKAIDVDLSVVLADGSPSGYELIYFNNKNSKDGSVLHLGDNLTGDAGYVTGAIDKENIMVDLSRVASGYDRVIVVLDIYNGAGLLGEVPGFSISIKDKTSGKKLIGYTVNDGYDRNDSMVVGVARRANGGWEFKAIGKGTDCNNNVHTLAAYSAKTNW